MRVNKSLSEGLGAQCRARITFPRLPWGLGWGDECVLRRWLFVQLTGSQTGCITHFGGFKHFMDNSLVSFQPLFSSMTPLLSPERLLLFLST